MRYFLYQYGSNIIIKAVKEKEKVEIEISADKFSQINLKNADPDTEADRCSEITEPVFMAMYINALERNTEIAKRANIFLTNDAITGGENNA